MDEYRLNERTNEEKKNDESDDRTACPQWKHGTGKKKLTAAKSKGKYHYTDTR